MLIDIFADTQPPIAPADAEPRSCEIRIEMPSMARQGVVDVLSMRSLVRACRYAFQRPQQDEFERALAKMINVNGAMAQVIERGRVRRG